MTCAGFWKLLQAVPAIWSAVEGLFGSFAVARRAKRTRERQARSVARAKLTSELEKPEITDADRARIAAELAALSPGRKRP